MPTSRPTLGIIGTGSFGQFAAEKLKPYFDIRLVGRKSSDAQFIQAASSDYLVLAIPYDAYDETLDKLKPLLQPETVIVDVCSVKTLPVQAIKRRLPGQPFLATHPLFGPESAAKSLAGQTIILCPQKDSQLEKRAAKFFKKLGLQVIAMSEAKHDKLMADLQGLTFFVARALDLYGIDEREIMTPSYKRLLHLARLEAHHSPELFATIQLANPQAPAAVKRFAKIVKELESALESKNGD